MELNRYSYNNKNILLCSPADMISTFIPITLSYATRACLFAESDWLLHIISFKLIVIILTYNKLTPVQFIYVVE